MLLVMATGTGKTYTTFQIIWRLWMDRILVLNQRTKLGANRVMQYLRATDPFYKTIIVGKLRVARQQATHFRVNRSFKRG